MWSGWFHLATGAGVGRLFGFVSNLLLSRWLGPTELGLFNLVTTTIQTTDTLVRCGGDYALNFELGGQPEAIKTEHGTQLAKGFAQLCSLMTVLVCVGVAVWVWCGQGLLPMAMLPSQRLPLCSLLLLMIAFEGMSASAWEVLLASHRTAPLALRQGLFFPLRLLFSAVGALFGGILGAMGGWVVVSFFQIYWLKKVLGALWAPLLTLPLFAGSILHLLKRGLPFYVANLLASMIFFPLLLRVAAGSGLAEIGYLRIGQILQQLFAFMPATLVPVLFLKLRTESSFVGQVVAIEKPLRVIWFLLLEFLLLYCMIDQSVIALLFGSSFAAALQPTRLLLITALFESLAQLVVQPLLASGKTRLYGLWQNGSAILAAILGWLWIPNAGLAAYLIVRLLYVFVPLIAFGMPVARKFQEPQKMLLLALTSIGLLALVFAQILNDITFVWMPSVLLVAFVFIPVLHHQDLLLIRKIRRGIT